MTTTVVTITPVVVDNTHIGKRLARLRRYTGLSARGLDLLAGAARGTTALLELGRRDTMSAETASKYIRALGCSLEWLIGGVGKAPTEAHVSTAIAAAKSRAAKKVA